MGLSTNKKYQNSECTNRSMLLSMDARSALIETDEEVSLVRPPTSRLYDCSNHGLEKDKTKTAASLYFRMKGSCCRFRGPTMQSVIDVYSALRGNLSSKYISELLFMYDIRSGFIL